jgi:hypothetical protein
MAKDGPSSTLSPFQRFEALAKALFAVPKKATEKAVEIRRKPIRKPKTAERP